MNGSRPVPAARYSRIAESAAVLRQNSATVGWRQSNTLDDLSVRYSLQLDDLQSADQINQFLAKLLLLVVQNRISARRAAVLAYITNQLLRTLPAIANEENAKPTTIIVDMPGPEDERVPVPEPTYADVRT